MAQCKWCEKRSFFLSVDRNGLCGVCQPRLIEVASRLRVMVDSQKLAYDGKSTATRISRCDLVIEHAEFLLEFERRGIATCNPKPSAVLAEYRALRRQVILGDARELVDAAVYKADVASSPKAKERALSAALVKLRDVVKLLDDAEDTEELEQKLRQLMHRATLDGYLEEARKAEFKGNVKKAIDQYQEALYFIKNDGIDDELQQDQIGPIESKLKTLSAKPG